MDGFAFKQAARKFAIRDRLANALKPHIGTFDHTEMTIAEIGMLGCRRLRLQSRKGSELHTLQGYFAAKRTAGTMDSAINQNSAVNQYINHNPNAANSLTQYLNGGKSNV
ncbi:MAG: hypothetical protein FWG52_02110 [Proteobacteria bacterium]|nr:hypothetical protein [Pseudomonadota bacterium]